MPNAKQHIITGAAVSAGTNLFLQWLASIEDSRSQINWWEVAAAAGAGGVAALLPDILEPATSPNHRQFCHSIVAGVLVFQLTTGQHTRSLPGDAKRLLGACGVSYLSHLILDSETPLGISII